MMALLIMQESLELQASLMNLASIFIVFSVGAILFDFDILSRRFRRYSAKKIRKAHCLN